MLYRRHWKGLTTAKAASNMMPSGAVTLETMRPLAHAFAPKGKRCDRIVERSSKGLFIGAMT